MDIICLQIDLARQKENLPYIKSYIDFAAKCGYNALLAYLENAVRTDDTQYFDKEQTYSAQEIREIVIYAKEKGIEVIPALENLGHLDKFFVYPQLESLSECEDETMEGRGFSPLKRGACGCSQNPKLYEFFDKYIEDVCSLFDSNYVHIGLDEPFDFAVCPRCRTAIEKGKSKADLFYEHVMHSYALLRKIGKRMMMWDDFFEYADIVKKLPRDIIFCNWNYMYVENEPSGHWTNRVKRDWFYYYDSLGFDYMFCTYAHGASSTYNVNTFTDYAKKYKPIGVLMTAWEKSSSFYLGSYPLIAYASALWNGKCNTKEEMISIYTDIVGDKDCANLLLSLQIPTFYYGFDFDVGNISENGYLSKRRLTAQLEYAQERLKFFEARAEGFAQDIIGDIYGYVKEFYLGLETERLGEKVFDSYENKKFPPQYFLKRIETLETAYRELEQRANALWTKFRFGIKSCNNDFERKYEGYYKRLAKLKADILNNEHCGILYVDLMLHDGYCTVKMEIKVKYKDEENESLVYRGRAKSSLVGFDAGGCYGLRFVIKNKEIERISFAVYGEGALYPLNFRYRVNDKKYQASKVERITGKVFYEQNVLSNDTRFAIMGNDDGVAHFNEIALSKEKHIISVEFAEVN